MERGDAGVDGTRSRILRGGVGLKMFTRLHEELVKNYPVEVVVQYMNDVVVQVIKHMRVHCVDWYLKGVWRITPGNVLNEGEKEKLVKLLGTESYETSKEQYDEHIQKYNMRCRVYNSMIY